MQTILPFLQRHTHEMVQILRVLVEHESPSHDKSANDRLAQVLARTATALAGGSAQLIANPERGEHVRVELNGQVKCSPQILMLGHFDTVWPQGTLNTMPFRIEDGKAFGPGVFDMKAGIVQGLFALLALRELRRDIRCKIVFLMTSDEEIGSHTSRALIEAEAARSRCVLVLEPAAGPQGALKTSRKGTGTFRIDVKGVSAHAGLEPEKGRSAIEELSRQIVHLHGMSNAERGITLNVGRIKGGTASNVVAPSASALLDLRIQKLADADEVLPRILGIQPFLEGTRLTVQGELNRPPLERSEQVVALYQRACRIAQSEMSFELPETAVGGASDGNFTAPFAPTLDGLGAVGDGAHANHEHIVIEELPRRSALLARLIEELSQEPYEPQHPPSEQ